MLKPVEDLERRTPAWEALSDLFLDTELQDFHLRRMARVLAESSYTDHEIRDILYREVLPVCIVNLYDVAGVWLGFPSDWLVEQILSNTAHPQIRVPVLPDIAAMIAQHLQKVMKLLPEARESYGMFVRAAKANNPLPAKNLVILNSVETLNISSIQRGVLFLLAVWSTPALIALDSVYRVLSRLNLGDLKFYVVNVDELPDSFCAGELAGFARRGWGETFWIRDGHIQSRLLRPTPEQENVIENYTRDLL
jgi:hypothetical protein